MTGRRDTSGWDMDTTRLRDAVERFADAPRADDMPSRTPPPDLMRSLRRRQRRTRAVPAYASGVVAAVSVVAIVLAVVAGVPALLRDGVGGPDGTSVATAPPPDALIGAIPRRIPPPGRWIDIDPMPGVAAAIVRGDDDARGRLPWGSRLGVAVLSARTGAYTWLDLPLAPGRAFEVELSPTGRYVAYWAALDDARPGRLTTFVVRDLITGEEESWTPDGTPRGAEMYATVWTDAATVAVAYGRVLASPGSSRQLPTILMDAVSGRVEQASGVLEEVDSATQVISPQLALAALGEDEVQVLDSRGEVQDRVSQPMPSSNSSDVLALSPSGSRLAAIENGGWDEGMPRTRLLHTARALPGGNRAGIDGYETVRTDGATLLQIVGWVDETHLAIRGYEGSFPDADATQIVSVDITTGATELLTDDSAYASYASALWTRPTVDRPAPASPADPRLLGLGGLLLAAAVVWWARRRRAGGAA